MISQPKLVGVNKLLVPSNMNYFGHIANYHIAEIFQFNKPLAALRILIF